MEGRTAPENADILKVKRSKFSRIREKAVKRLSRTVVWLPKRFYTRGVILMYHRIGEQDVDPWSLCVTPQRYAEHLEVLRKHAEPITLKEMAPANHKGRIPHRAVAITFDDGYANNLYYAKPILERYKMPATVFVTTGYIGKNREFWWDELDQVLLKPGRLPERLCLRINGRTRLWELGGAFDYSEDDCRRDYGRTAPESQPGSRLHFYYSVCQQLQVLTDKRRGEAVDEILSWAGVVPAARPTHRSLSLEELSALEQGGFVEVGAHTVTHPLLSEHAIGLQRGEIQQSKADLEEILGHPVTSFAYPFGAYREETISIVRAAGFSRACSTDEETVWRHSDCFQLPRFEVRNWDGETFERRLLRWFGRWAG